MNSTVSPMSSSQTVSLVDLDLTFLPLDQPVQDFADLPTMEIDLVDTMTGIVTSQPVKVTNRTATVKPRRDPAVVDRMDGRTLEKAIKELFGFSVDFHRQLQRGDRDGNPDVNHENTGAAFRILVEQQHRFGSDEGARHQLEIGGTNKYRLGMDLGHGVYCSVIVPKEGEEPAENFRHSTSRVIKGVTSLFGNTAYLVVRRVREAGPLNARSIDLDFLQAKIKAVYEAEIENLLSTTMSFLSIIEFFPMLTEEEMEVQRRKNEVKMVMRRASHDL